MNQDIRIKVGFTLHPKTVKLYRRLGAAGPWHLLCLFCWVAENRPDGQLTNMDQDDIAIAAQWPGATGEFISALLETRFLNQTPEGYQIHDWLEHNPYAAAAPKRIERSKKAALARWGEVNDVPAQDSEQQAMLNDAKPCSEHQQAMLNHAQSISEQCSEMPLAQQAYAPNLTYPNLGLDLEAKDSSYLEKQSNAASPPSGAAAAAVSPELSESKKQKFPHPSKLKRLPNGDYPYPPEFEAIWNQHGRGSKKAGYRWWWERVAKEGLDPAILVEAYNAYAAECDRKDRAKQDTSTFFGPQKETFRQYLPKPRSGPIRASPKPKNELPELSLDQKMEVDRLWEKIGALLIENHESEPVNLDAETKPVIDAVGGWPKLFRLWQMTRTGAAAVVRSAAAKMIAEPRLCEGPEIQAGEGQSEGGEGWLVSRA